MPVIFDHIEIHVADIPRYCEFLTALFGGGRYRRINDAGFHMYLTPEGQAFELKPKATDLPAARSGFCLPCIRTSDARAHLERLGLAIDESAALPDGSVHFFTDHEGIQWHVKEYDHADGYVRW